MGVEFYPYRDQLSEEKRIDKSIRNIDPEDFYNGFARHIIQKYGQTETAGNYMCMIRGEQNWYRFGKPYYKIWPNLLIAMCEININIDTSFFHMPYDAFVINLPIGQNMLQKPNEDRIQSILVGRYDHPKGDNDFAFFVHFTISRWLVYDEESGTAFGIIDENGNVVGLPMGGPTYQKQISYEFIVNLKESDQNLNDVIEEHIKEDYTLTEFGPGADDKPGYIGPSLNNEGVYKPSEETVRRILKLAIATCFFGTNSHEIIMPDLPRRKIRRYHRAKSEGNLREQRKILEEAKRRGMFGWKVGSEIDLPAPVVEHLTSHESREKRELKYGHIRTGHVRMQQKGPRRDPYYELVFIEPTLVRPDLPFRASHGYRIGRK